MAPVTFAPAGAMTPSAEFLLFLISVAVGWERNNKYRLCNSAEQQFMYAKEGKSDLQIRTNFRGHFICVFLGK